MDYSNYVYVDADFFIALNNSEDPNHGRAVRCVSYIDGRSINLVTSELVLMEISTILSMKLGRQRSKEIIEDIEEGNIEIIKLESETYNLSKEINRAQNSKNVSAFDTYHMQEMRNHNINTVLSFDSDFRKNGFTLVVDIMEGKLNE